MELCLETGYTSLNHIGEELCGDVPVLGRMKELVSYWCAVPRWRRLWSVVKLCRTVDELLSLVN